MNERIEQLAKKAGINLTPAQFSGVREDEVDEFTLEDFAELIVSECAGRVTSKANGWGDMTGFAIKESILDCANDLKKHFGVEE